MLYVEKSTDYLNYGLYYQNRGLDADVSVVRLFSNIVYTPVIQRIAIAAQDTVLSDNLSIVHAGLGHTSVHTNVHTLLCYKIAKKKRAD